MTACSQFDIKTVTCNMSQTTGDVSPTLRIKTPNIRIKDLKELQTPTLTKISNVNTYITPVVNQENTLVRNADVSSSITNHIRENEKSYSQIHNQLLMSNKKQSSRLLKLQLKERVLKKRLQSLEESRAIYLRKKRKKGRSSLLPSNSSCSLTDLDGKPILVKSQQSEIKKFDTDNLRFKFTPVSHIEQLNLCNIRRENYNNNIIHFTNNWLPDPSNGFEFIDASHESYVEFKEDLTDTSACEYTSCTENEKSTDFESKGVTYLKQNILPEFPSIEKSDDVDSTSLRDGIIKASRTLINTQKALKFLSNSISRNESLPTKQAINLLNRYQGILNMFNKGFNEIDQAITNEYNYILSEFDSKTLLQQTNENDSLCNTEQKREVVVKKDENCGKDTNIEQANSFVCRSKTLDVSIGGKNYHNKRKKRGPKAHKSDDEDIDRTFLPVAKAQVFESIPRRENYPRSCQKRKMYIDNE